jgi:hypothetical protein
VLHTANHEGYEALRDDVVAWKGTLRRGKQRKAGAVVVDDGTDRRAMVECPASLAAGRQNRERSDRVDVHDEDGAAEGRGEALDQSGAGRCSWDLYLKPTA